MLDALTAGALEDAEARRGDLPYDELERLARASRTPIDVVALLAQPVDGVHVIAEVKRASPSKGRIADIPEPAALAAAYAAGGASVISVLTEGRRFLGTLDDLRAVRDAVDVAVLRKDFLSTRYQLLEARAAGADLVLLIVAALDDDTLADLHAFATELGLSVLVEVHDADEVRRALAVGARIVGVNTRDLKTFAMHPERFAELRPLIPEGVVAVAESGVQSVDDVRSYRAAGAHAVLVGETLVRDGEPAARVAAFRSAS